MVFPCNWKGFLKNIYESAIKRHTVHVLYLEEKNGTQIFAICVSQFAIRISPFALRFPLADRGEEGLAAGIVMCRGPPEADRCFNASLYFP